MKATKTVNPFIAIASTFVSVHGTIAATVNALKEEGKTRKDILELAAKAKKTIKDEDVAERFSSAVYASVSRAFSSTHTKPTKLTKVERAEAALAKLNSKQLKALLVAKVIALGGKVTWSK